MAQREVREPLVLGSEKRRAQFLFLQRQGKGWRKRASADGSTAGHCTATTYRPAGLEAPCAPALHGGVLGGEQISAPGRQRLLVSRAGGPALLGSSGTIRPASSGANGTTSCCSGCLCSPLCPMACWQRGLHFSRLF